MEGVRNLCLDTDVLIDYIRRPSEAVKLIMEKVYEGKVSAYTTTINSFEIWLGVYLAPKPEELIKETGEFLSQLKIVSFDYKASREASRVMTSLRKQGQPIEIRDLFIGSSSKVSGMPLITRNVRHYKRIAGLTVLTPEETIEQLKLSN